MTEEMNAAGWNKSGASARGDDGNGDYVEDDNDGGGLVAP